MTNAECASDSLFVELWPAAHVVLRADHGLEFFLTHSGDDALIHGIADVGAAGVVQHAAQHIFRALRRNLHILTAIFQAKLPERAVLSNRANPWRKWQYQ